jgi:hypothetical protein
LPPPRFKDLSRLSPLIKNGKSRNTPLSLQTISAARVVVQPVNTTHALFSLKVRPKKIQAINKDLESIPPLSDNLWRPSVIEDNGKKKAKEQERTWRCRRPGGYFWCCSPSCFWCSSLVVALLLAGLAALLIATLSNKSPARTETSISVSLCLSNLALLLSVNSNKNSGIDCKHVKR